MKFMRSRRVSLILEEPKAIQEEFDTFTQEITDVGSTLRNLREEKKWSQDQLGEKVGIDGAHIAHIEDGKQPIPIKLAKKFAEIFNTDYDTFI